jgi:hypothetical protein
MGQRHERLTHALARQAEGVNFFTYQLLSALAY